MRLRCKIFFKLFYKNLRGNCYGSYKLVYFKHKCSKINKVFAYMAFNIQHNKKLETFCASI